MIWCSVILPGEALASGVAALPASALGSLSVGSVKGLAEGRRSNSRRSDGCSSVSAMRRTRHGCVMKVKIWTMQAIERGRRSEAFFSLGPEDVR